jgi:hypothetical protein
MKGMKRIARLAAVLLLGTLASVDGADVSLYKVTKGIRYQQLPGGVPSVLAENGYVFQADVFLIATGTVSSASVVSSEGTVRTLTFDKPDKLEFRNRVNTRSTLETRYPDGNFRFTINAVHDGSRGPTLTLLGNVYPNAPVIQGLAALQLQNADGYTVVTWEPFIGGTVNDFIQLRIEDGNGELVWETPDPGESGALDGFSRFAVIKAGKLKPNTRYNGALTFEKTSGRDTGSYPGALGWSTYHARTEFTIGTGSAGAPNIHDYRVSKGRGFEQTNSGAPFPEPESEFIFDAQVQGLTSSLVLGASLTLPTGAITALRTNTDCGDDFELADTAASQSLLDAKYPAGNYRFEIDTASEGVRSPTLYLNAAEYPPAPHVNFDPNQKVRADQDLRIVWDLWTNGCGTDFIRLRIDDNPCDEEFETPNFDDKDRLDGHATSALVPAGTLKPGKTYSARLTFRQFESLDANSYPGALGTVSYFSRTKFKIRTLPPDVKKYEVTKGRIFTQSSPGTVLATGFVFKATLDADTAQSVNTASITTPAGRTVFLVQQASGDEFKLKEIRASQADLDTEFPDGNYVLTIDGANDGRHQVPIALTGGVYPNAPRLNNYEAAGRINPEADFELQWDAFGGGAASDFINVKIEDKNGTDLFETDGYGKGDALNGFNTAVTIPMGTLKAAKMYVGQVRFEKVLRANDEGYSGVDGRVSYSSETDVSLMTAGPGNPPTIQSYRVLPDGRLQFSVITLDGGTYQLQGSVDMVNWALLGTIVATDSRVTFIVPPPVVGPCYFYRTVLMR